MLTLRLVKAAFVAAVALFALLVGLNNLIDYDSNFQFVRHVLSMDTTFEGNRLMNRALTAPWIHHTAYALIIAAELATAALTAWGAWALYRARHESAAAFARASTTATLGLALGIGLWLTGFLTIGAEWFLMWQSQSWNGQQAAFRFTMVLFAVLIFLHLPETPSETQGRA
ncbi:MAG: DUF2165 domain-containing protein [Pseudomonadota bacterium]